MKQFDFSQMSAYQPVRGKGMTTLCDDAGGCDAYHDCDGGSQYDD